MPEIQALSHTLFVPLTPYGETQLNKDWSCLTCQEQQRARDIKHEDTRHQFMACRAALRRLLAAHCKCAATEVPLQTSAHGKPTLAMPGIHFNVSHTQGLGVIGLSTRTPIGVDVESIQTPIKNPMRLAQRFFHPNETAWLAAQSDLPTAFIKLWTLKEAVIKAEGCGLSNHLSTFDVCETLKIPHTPILLNGHTFLAAHINAPLGYIAATAVQK